MANYTEDDKKIILDFLKRKINELPEHEQIKLNSFSDEEKINFFSQISTDRVIQKGNDSKVDVPNGENFLNNLKNPEHCTETEREQFFKLWLDETKKSEASNSPKQKNNNDFEYQKTVINKQTPNEHNKSLPSNSQNLAQESSLKAANINCNHNDSTIPEKINVNEKIKIPEHYDKKSIPQIKNLKNGMVGREYSDKIDFPYGLKDCELLGLDKIGGLEFRKETQEIIGYPKNAGLQEKNHEIQLKLSYTTYDNEKKEIDYTIKIFPDPKSLWRELEPDENLGYGKPHSDSIFEEFQFDNHSDKTNKIVIASKRGRSHAHNGLYRDDDFKHKVFDNGWLALAVADGAGSCKFSRHGSKLACNKVVEFLEAKLKDQENEKLFVELLKKIDRADEQNKEMKNFLYKTVADSVYNTAKSLEQEAIKMKVKFKDLSTTIMICIMKKTELGFFIAGFWIGDGALCIYESNSKISLLGKSDGGEFAGQTRFLTTTEVLTPIELSNRLRYKFVDNFLSVFAMTDGVSDSKFNTDKNLEDIVYWNNLYQELLTLGVYTDTSSITLLNWLDFWAEGNHDDRTIAIVY